MAAPDRAPAQRGHERCTLARTPVTANVAADTAALVTRPVPRHSVHADAECRGISVIGLLLGPARWGDQPQMRHSVARVIDDAHVLIPNGRRLPGLVIFDT